MRVAHVLTITLLGLGASNAYCASQGHQECERQFKRLSKNKVTAVPEVQDWGNAREHYFAWNKGTKSMPLQTTSGPASGSCIIDRKTGEGFVTLNSKDLGSFKAKAPL